MDTFSAQQRSRIMRAVRSKDTQPELAVRRLVHSLGYRYRLHRADLPGNPDLVFPGRGKVIFVHGCFWHHHRCKRGRRIPGTRTDYWLAKLRGNQKRDQMTRRRLRRSGWQVMVIWECQIKPDALESLTRRIFAFLDG